ncbi:NADPH-dependent FMN reductase [Paenibacillus arenilitoris]|uniref:NAD(P)H-dependent oxidoreductase n=1 Tax=Paenibacillus arenilitoris TaxID=2772299 RepID=A0A927H7M5_9BACL|nr:NADPH-dependent FMN reductase [Paenibacillus arenilitoris]MBD2870813.1 NAD(P)H-dependent oxidoreductase [Paenibacillus arenilitoris]
MKITLIAGSNRTNAASTQLLRYVETLLKARGLQTNFLDLRQLTLPLYSPDSEELHPNARLVAESVADSDGLVLATPEYHGSVSGALKNALDYINAGQVAGKPVLSVSAAGGPVGVSSLGHLQAIVRNLHGINCPEWISAGYGTNGFGPDGAPLDEGLRSRIEGAVANFAELVQKLKATAATAN